MSKESSRENLRRDKNDLPASIASVVRRFVAEQLESRVLLSAAPTHPSTTLVPQITSVTPDPVNMTENASVRLEITGTNFNLDTKDGFDPANPGSGVVVLYAPGDNGQSFNEIGQIDVADSDSTHIIVNTTDFANETPMFPISDQWSAQVIDYNEASGVQGDPGNIFPFNATVYNQAPQFDQSATILKIPQNGNLGITLTGENFQVNKAALAVNGSGEASLTMGVLNGNSFNLFTDGGLNLNTSTDQQLNISTADLDGLSGTGFVGFTLTNPSGQSGSYDFQYQTVSAPTITTQPVSQTVTTGGTAAFGVSITSEDPASYQWQFNGATIAGATNSTLVLNNAGAAQAGAYTVVVSSDGGSATSSPATLTVNAASNPTGQGPVIISQPQPQSVATASNVTFSVSATGAAPIQYQWQFNGAAIAGQTGSTLTLNSVTAAQVGSYAVVVSNGSGSVTSSAAALTVSTPVVTAPSGPLTFSLSSPASGKTGKKAKAVLTIVNTSSSTVKQAIAIDLVLSSNTTLAGEIAELLSAGKTVNLKAGRSKQIALSFKVPVVSAGNYNLLANLNGQTLIVAPSQIAVVLSPTKK